MSTNDLDTLSELMMGFKTPLELLEFRDKMSLDWFNAQMRKECHEYVTKHQRLIDEYKRCAAEHNKIFSTEFDINIRFDTHTLVFADDEAAKAWFSGMQARFIKMRNCINLWNNHNELLRRLEETNAIKCEGVLANIKTVQF